MGTDYHAEKNLVKRCIPAVLAFRGSSATDSDRGKEEKLQRATRLGQTICTSYSLTPPWQMSWTTSETRHHSKANSKRLAALFGSHHEIGSSSERSIKRQLVVLGDPGAGKTHLIEALTSHCAVPETWRPSSNWPAVPIEIDLDSEAFTVQTLPIGHREGKQNAADVTPLNSRAERVALHIQCREPWTSEDHRLVRTLVYPGTDVAVLCAAVDDPISLRNAVDRWYPEIRHYMPTVPILIIGTKADLREDSGEDASKFINQQEIQEAIQRTHALGYIDCSARTFEGVQEVVGVLARACLQSRLKSKDDGCVIS